MQNKIVIWPNPAGDVIAARLPANGAYAVRIINSSGELVKEIWDIRAEDLYIRLDISDLSQGFYLLVISDNDFQGTGRLIVCR